MSFINPALSFIKYRKRKIKIVYKKLDDCYGLYDPNKQTLYFDQNIKSERLFNTFYHELFHVICYNDGIDVNQRGEEPIAQAVGDGYTRIFKQNPKLWDILQECLYG
jgi:Zn-dependent peptidase ImmA (M78 family)